MPASNLTCVHEFYRFHSTAKIGDLIRREVVPYVRKIESLPPTIEAEAMFRANSESAESYLNNLRRAWDRHNRFANVIDAFLRESAVWPTLRISEQHLGEAARLLSQAMPVEDEKRIYSAGVKSALDKSIREARARYQFSTLEVQIAFGLWEPPYWVYRNGMHALWLLAERGVNAFGVGSKTPSVSELCSTFHASCEQVFAERKEEDWFLQLARMKSHQLLEVVRKWKGYGRDTSWRTHAVYLVLERPELRAAQNLIRYDNFNEYLFGANLFGVPDLLLRRMTINTLVSLGLLDARESVLLYDLEEIENAVRAANPERKAIA